MDLATKISLVERATLESAQPREGQEVRVSHAYGLQDGANRATRSPRGHTLFGKNFRADLFAAGI